MKNILVVHPCSHVFNIPCVVSVVEGLASEQSNNVIFPLMVNSGKTSPTGVLSERVKVVRYLFVQEKRKEPVIHWFVGYLVFLLIVLIKNRVSVYIAIGFKGLILSWIVAKVSPRPIVYYNLEFNTNLRPRTLALIAVRIERWIVKSIQALIIHDDNRKRIYETIVNCEFKQYVIYPNYPVTCRKDEDHCAAIKKKFDIKDHRKYIIYSGGLAAGIGLERLCKNMLNTSDEWTLILQSHDGINRVIIDDTIAMLVDVGKIKISPKPLNSLEYSALLSLCQIGVAMYDSNDINMGNVGLSSGKIAAYWSHGLPIIVNRLPVYTEILAADGGGRCFESIDKIYQDIATIELDYDYYSNSALLCFKKYFNKEKGNQALLNLFRVL